MNLVLRAAPGSSVFLDPACGDGSFLAWIAEHVPGSRLFGIEIDPGSAAAAQVRVRSATILCADALEVDWVGFAGLDAVVVGNPPFVGASLQSSTQKSQTRALTGKGFYDFAAAFAAKAKGLPSAFVLPASLTRGSQAKFWDDVEIDFAVRAQPWPGFNDPSIVVIGAGFGGVKTLIGADKVSHPDWINGFLLPLPKFELSPSANPGPPIVYGNQIVDDGNWLFTNAEHQEFLSFEPGAVFVQWVDGQSLLDAPPNRDGVDTAGFRWLLLGAECADLPPVAERNAKVAAFRARSKSAKTRAMGLSFNSRFSPTKRYLAIPAVSSENRFAVPVAFMDGEVWPSGKVFSIPGAGLFEFAVLSSVVHKTWVDAVAGRLENRWSYSTSVYRGFIFPRVDQFGCDQIERAAGRVLNARDPRQSLGDQYLRPHPELLEAHRELDIAVLAGYGLGAEVADLEILEMLFSYTVHQEGGERGQNCQP